MVICFVFDICMAEESCDFIICTFDFENEISLPYRHH